MTVTAATPETTVALSGTGLGPFSTVWKYESAAEVKVYLVTSGVEALLTAGDDYALVGSTPLASGGAVTLDSGVRPSGGFVSGTHSLVMRRQTAATQAVAFGAFESFRPAAVEAALDRLTRGAQDLWRAVAGAAASAVAGVASFNGRDGVVTLTDDDVIDALGYTPGAETAGGMVALTIDPDTDVLDLSALPQNFVATVTPGGDGSERNIQSFGSSYAGHTGRLFPTTNAAVICDGVKIKGNRYARDSGASGFAMDEHDSFQVTCLGGELWHFAPEMSEIGRRMWPQATSGSEPEQAYTYIGDLGKFRPQDYEGWPGDIPFGSAIFMKDENTHKLTVGGLKLINFGDSAALFSIVAGLDEDGYPKQTTRLSDSSNWWGGQTLVQDAGWYDGLPFIPGGDQLATLGDSYPGSIAQGIHARVFHMPTGRGPTNTAGGWQTHTTPQNTITPMLATMEHDNGNHICWGPTRYEFSVDLAEFTAAYPQSYGAPFLGPVIDADFTHAWFPSVIDARWQQFKGHANYNAVCADLTVGGLSNRNGGFALVNPFDRHEALVWGRVGHTRGAPSVGYYGLALRTSSDRSTQKILEKIDPATGARNLPLQPRFLAHLSAAITNVTGNSTVYTVAFNAERFDRGGNFNTGTGRFTAPVAGDYDLKAQVQLAGVSAGATRVTATINVYASGGSLRYAFQKDGGDLAPDGSGQVAADIAAIADMNAGDYAVVTIRVDGNGADDVDVSAGDPGSGLYQTFFAGRLIG